MERGALAYRTLGSPGDDPHAERPPPLRSDISLALKVDDVIPKSQAKLSINMYASTHGGKEFVVDRGEYSSCV